MLDDEERKPSAEDQKVADAMMDELEALMKPGSVYVSLNCITFVRSIHLLVRMMLLSFYYRAMHFSANARYWESMSSVRLSVCLSVRL